MSIQYSLSGLSFCSPADGKHYGPVSIEELPVLLHEANGAVVKTAERINLVVNTDRFAVVPVEIYNQDYDKDYLYTKNIVCGEDEIIMNSSTGAAVVIFPVKGRLVEELEKEAPEVRVVHTLNPCLSLAYRYAEKTKKYILVSSMYEGVFSYAVVGKKNLLAVDCTADGGVAKAETITELLDGRYGISRGAVLLDDNGALANIFKRVVGKTTSLSYGEYLGIIDEDSKR